MGNENLRAARCRVRRLMREMGLKGATRGRAWVTTTQPAPAPDRPRDLVDRQFTATLVRLGSAQNIVSKATGFIA